MRVFFKGLLLIGCILVILGAILDRHDPPVAPLIVLGVASAVILALTLLLRRFAPRLGRWPARISLAGGLILFTWGSVSMRNATGWEALGAVALVALGLLLLISTGLVSLVAWMVDDRHPPSLCPEASPGVVGSQADDGGQPLVGEAAAHGRRRQYRK